MTRQSTTPADSEFLLKALALAEGGRGRVSPNPLVGSVIVRDGEIIGEGFHAELGGLHAERAALADAARRGEDVAGATIYVTLEPCAHQGRQPPCVDAILEADLSRVVIASDDPTAKAAGRGPEALRASGVEVDVVDPADEAAAAARSLNQPFRKHALTGLPWVVSKTAMSLDGRTSTPAGASPWISGERSRELVHVWRGECDAIAVGIGTALADDPLLTARLGEARQPVRVVFDSAARLPLDSQLVATIDEAPLSVVHGPDADPARLEALLRAGAETILADGPSATGRVPAALAELGRRGLTSMLLEGGATLAAAFAAADQIDEARVFVAPLILGGPTPAPGIPTRLEGGGVEAEVVGEDTLIRTRFKEW
ncbi:MAG TPA: bifunctional diaminohydroxyphosphoribosylaminopyrimidine deaminase/5-amino-6-(5-phosphoribosylamino)uracil reductase RibD [Solirubrobacterales bacterium]|nr:bifunctional diaminohydroxyphosphoribosylaminopyrimidine deaminase/5-amino-6-(5-phosphoribosylamino)uracil reductase RibD [Solirubrobacterales bacterium]